MPFGIMNSWNFMPIILLIYRSYSEDHCQSAYHSANAPEHQPILVISCLILHFVRMSPDGILLKYFTSTFLKSKVLSLDIGY